ncbi:MULTISPECIES: spore coat protein [Peribacillus]|uniref:spore coat protein n=1 Tax=Peribacillus TaxID=2675229 RepID=UPI001F4EC6E5|nr:MULTISPECIES: spore coat protein [unclassified Peribacillus]MCK1983644.1 spore coat protein [Peribacillus sp. Aquil_B1]MCK2010871.1 spore coat protein [Peribacillus sp. Aquil_B8]
MEMDFLDPQGAEHMPEMADSSFALDFLLTVKSGIHTYGIALSETASPELRKALYRQMEHSIDLHAEITDLMISKGWLYPNDVGKQVELDLKSADMAVSIAGMKLFPNDTDRLGMFATPSK